MFNAKKKLLVILSVLLAGLSALPAAAQTAVQSGDLIKSDAASAVYYFGGDGKRYVFPTERTYFTWYADFSKIKTITVGELAALPLGGNVTYRPGVKMLKIQSDPTVYAISKGGVLRAIGSEAIASALYGSTWNKQIDDLPDAFFINYKVGAPIAVASGYDKAILVTAVPTINVDKLFAPSPTGFIDIRQGVGFTPNSLTVAPGTNVTWIALDGSLPSVNLKLNSSAYSNPPSYQSGTLHMGETYSYVFSQTGTWSYQNGNATSQTGTVIVQ